MNGNTFIFGGNTGAANAQELAQRRELLNALMAQQQVTPRTFGEGLSAIGQAIAWRIRDKKLKGEEQAAREAAQGQFSAITGQLMGGGGRYGMPAQMSRPVPDPNSPAGIGDATMQALGRVPSNGTPITQADIVAGLTKRGLPPHVAAGFAVNAQDESAMNPAAQEASPMVAGSRGGFGLMQWTGPRRVALERYAQQRGLPVDNAELQLDFLAQEMQGSEAQAGNAILSTQSAPDAAKAIVEQFLRPAPPHMNARAGAYTQDPQVLAQLAELAQNPYAPQGQQMIAQQLMQQQLAQMQPQDPMKDIELQKAQLELQKMQQPQTPKYRMLTPQEAQQMGLPDGAYQQDVSGKITPLGDGKPNLPAAFESLHLQAKAAGYKEGTPEYMNFMATAGAGLKEKAKSEGKADVAALANLGSQVAKADQAISLIDQIAQDPALPSILGIVQGNIPAGTPFIGGGQAGADLNAKVKQLQGQAFLEAFDALKGGGAITEIEGQKATEAMARLDRAQSPEAYQAALAELKGVIDKGRTRAEDRANQARGRGALQTSGGGVPSGVDPELWDEMTPEERALFQ